MFVKWGRTLSISRPNRRQEGAAAALLTLTSINLLNYADRYLPNGLKDGIKNELRLSDAQTSIPASSMLLAYMCCAPAFGMMVDKNLIDRRALLGLAVAFWSLATGLAGFANNLMQLVLFRSLVGVGEAAYATICPPLIADFFPLQDRNVAFMVYNLASSLGSALGFVLAGILGSVYGWRDTFFALGLPGMLFATFLPRLNDPARGVNDEALAQNNVEQSFWTDAQLIIKNKHWLCATGGAIAIMFAIGSWVEWYATLLSRGGGMSMEDAAVYMGACTIVGGIGGTVLGAKTAQYLDAHVQNARLMIAGLFTFPGAFCGFVAVNFVQYKQVANVSFLATITLCLAYSAPISTVSVTCMPVHLRSRAASLQIFLVHALGDMISPFVTGYISDQTGSLQAGMQLGSVAALVASVIWLIGSYLLPPLAQPHSDVKEGTNDHNSLTLHSLLFCSDDEDIDFDSAHYGSNDKGRC